MPLMTVRPSKHPKTGVYWFRRVVPADLRELVGKREEKRSLRTKDPDEAKRRILDVSREIEDKWASLRAGPKTLTEREAHEIAADVYHAWLALHRDNPSWQLLWHPELYKGLWTSPGYMRHGGARATVQIDEFFFSSMRRLCMQQADEIMGKRGLVLDDWCRTTLAKAIGAALQRASLVLERQSQGFDLDEQNTPPQLAVASAEPPKSEQPFTFDALVRDWVVERRPRPKTVYEATNMVRKFEVSIGVQN